MMKQAWVIGLVGLIVALAIAPAAWGQTKVGYVDVDRVTRKAKAVNKAMDNVQSDIETLQRQIDEKRQQIKELESDVQRSEGVVASSEIEKKRKEIARLRNELDDLAYRAERKARELDATVFEPLMKRILFAIQDVAKENKYDIVLRGEAVLYGTSAVDITDAVIRKLNEETTASSTSESSGPSAGVAKSSPTSSAPSPSEGRTELSPATPEEKQPPSEPKAAPATKKTTRDSAKPRRPVDRQAD